MSVDSHCYPILPDPNVILLQCPSIVIVIQFFPHFFLFSYISIAERNLVVNMHEMFSFFMEGIYNQPIDSKKLSTDVLIQIILVFVKASII